MTGTTPTLKEIEARIKLAWETWETSRKRGEAATKARESAGIVSENPFDSEGYQSAMESIRLLEDYHKAIGDYWDFAESEQQKQEKKGGRNDK